MNWFDRLTIARYNRLLRKKQDGAHKSLIPEFIDTEGRRWFTYAKGETPLLRAAKIKTYYDILQFGLDPDTLEKASEEMNACLAKGLIAEAGVVMIDLKKMKSTIVNFDAFINIIAVSYCREDEDPDTVTDHIHKEKIDFLKSETEQGRFFFRTAVWSDIARTFSFSLKDAEQLLIESEALIQNHMKRWSVLTSGKLSER
jgi:hypothetical protein